jgi:hypothetical protein
MWMLSFIPDSWLHLAVLLMMFSGSGLYGASFFLGFIPPTLPYKEPIRIFGSLLAILGVYCYGGYDVEMSWRAKSAELESKIAVAEAASKDANGKLSVALKAKDAAITANTALVKQQIRKDAAAIDATCIVAPVVITDLNNAARGVK